MNRQEELYHHGILSQKWGVRRYQNSDGTLTEAGKKRYFTSEGELNDAGRGHISSKEYNKYLNKNLKGKSLEKKQEFLLKEDKAQYSSEQKRTDTMIGHYYVTSMLGLGLLAPAAVIGSGPVAGALGLSALAIAGSSQVSLLIKAGKQSTQDEKIQKVLNSKFEKYDITPEDTTRWDWD